MMVIKIIFTAWILILSGCVSVNLPLNQKSTKAENVSYQDPSMPFVKQTSENNLDGLWISKNTKSTIGFYSLCHKNLPPLRNARSNSLNGIENSEIVKEDVTRYNDREALRSLIQGKLEGFVFQIESVLFVKDSCLFEISYVSYKENFDKERGIYNKFLEGFKVY